MSVKLEEAREHQLPRPQRAQDDLEDMVNRAAQDKQRTIVRRRGKDVAAVVPIEDLRVIQQEQDRRDIEDARAALAEPGENIPLEQVKAQWGLLEPKRLTKSYSRKDR